MTSRLNERYALEESSSNHYITKPISH